MNVRNLKNIRWAVNVGRWTPTEAEWCRAIQLIQVEEKERIEQFRYKVDMMSSLVGRLLLRGFAVHVLGLNNREVKFVRTDRGKPVLEVNTSGWDYNVSHAGDWVVLAAASQGSLGVDVMKTKDSRVDRLEEFFRIMRRQFTDEEWMSISGNQCVSDEDKLATFFRHWTLKESYVKAVGTGLNLDLRTLNFKIDEDLNPNCVITSSTLQISGRLTPWKFEESVLDEEHVVSVALTDNDEIENIPKFSVLRIDQIFNLFSQHIEHNIEAELLRPVEVNDFTLFNSKDHPKPF